MNKRILKPLIIACVLLFVSAITVYAAFVMTHNYEVDVEYHEINDAQLSSSTQDSKVSFTAPGDKIVVDYTLINNDNQDYTYYYSFDLTTTDNIYADMIYVYQNDLYCGVLRDFIGSELIERKDLPFNEYIFIGESRTTKFTFELHNEATSYVSNGLSVTIKIQAHLSTTNVQEILYATNSTFGNVMVDALIGENKTIVLKEDVSTSITNITKDCTIDLCGNTLTLSSAITISEGVTVKVIDSRGGGSVAGEGFVINDATSFVELEAPVSKITKTNYNKDRLIEMLENNYQENNVVYASETYDLFGYYSVYGLTASSSDVTITDGVIQTSTSNTNSVIVVTVEGTAYEFKYIGNDASAITDILDDHLKHLVQFESATNGIQVQHDLFLPTVIKEYNATISWHSSNQSVLSNDGVIQENQGNVLLTATIKVYDIVFVQEYYVYIVQPDNLSKLQYLIAKVEQGFTLNDDTEDTSDDIIYDVILTAVGQTKYLPVAGDSTLEHHYTLWTDGLKLGITDIEYSLEGVYQYIELTQTLTNDVVTDATVGLTQITYSKAARVMITATFDNGEVLSSYIIISINLGESSLADQVYDDIQTHLDKVDVLQNILDTRKNSGVLNESGDFDIPAKVDVVKVEYTSLNANLYEIQTVFVKDEQGNDTSEIDSYMVHFKDLKYLSLSEKSIPIKCQIVVDSVDEEGNETEVEINPRVLYFIVPGAITSENFVSSKIVDGAIEETKILDLTNTKIKILFYSIKLQTLQQAGCLYYNVTESETVNLVDVTDVSDIYDLGEYILFDDIESTTKLIFEYGRTETILDYYDLDILSKIFDWATYAPKEGEEKVITTVENTSGIASHIDANLDWISNDGEAELSDGEIAVILSYAEKYTGFKEIWEQVINPLDNELTDDEVTEMLKALAQDKTYTSILGWLTEGVNINIPLNQWLLIIDTESPYFDLGYTEITSDMLTQLSKDTNLPEELLAIVNGGEEYDITDDEERIIIYYVLANHPEKYSAFIAKWQEYINRNADISYVNKIGNNVVKNYIYSFDGTSTDEADAVKKTPNICYDPIFTEILNWANKSDSSSSGGETLGNSLGNEFSVLFSDISVSNGWYKYDAAPGTWIFESGTGIEKTFYSNTTTLVEWGVIVDYLSFYNIETVKCNTKTYEISTASNNPIVQILSIVSDDSDENVSSAQSNDAYGYAAEIFTYTYSANTGLGATNPSSKPYSPQLTLDFINALIDAVNAKYLNVTEYNKYYDAAVDNNQTVLTSDFDISQAELENYTIKDYTTKISYDEWNILSSSFNKMFDTENVDLNLISILTGYFIPSKEEMEMTKTSISNGYNAILSTVNDVQDFDAVVEEITNLGSCQSLGNYYCRACKQFYSYEQLIEGACPNERCNSMVISAYFDNLSTVSADEIKQLILIKPSETEYVGAIIAAFDAYSITVTSSGETYTVTVTRVTAEEDERYDRTLTDEDEASLKTLLNTALGSSGSKYIHISLDQITDTEVESFEILTHYSNLIELSFKGTSANYLFATNQSANATFNVVALGCDNLEKLSMNYCGITDITPVSNMLNLKHLNLRSNYQKDGYKGLESISELIRLNDLKNINSTAEVTYPNVEYVNVYNTNVTTERAQIVLGTLFNEYESENEDEKAEFWLDVFGEEMMYPFEENLDATKLAVYALSLLYELEIMNGEYIVLPDKVYRHDGTEDVYHEVTWRVVIANSLVKISTINSTKVLQRLANTAGQVTISASVTVTDDDGNEVTETRYFVIDVREITETTDSTQ